MTSEISIRTMSEKKGGVCDRSVFKCCLDAARGFVHSCTLSMLCNYANLPGSDLYDCIHWTAYRPCVKMWRRDACCSRQTSV